MTLHEAIERVLQDTGVAMSTGEIADEINSRDLYSRRDGIPVTASQVSARTNNYTKIFARDAGKIKLVKNDVISLLFQQFRNSIVHGSNLTPDSSRSDKIGVLLNVLEKLSQEVRLPSNKNQVLEPVLNYGQRFKRLKQNLMVGYRLSNWFLLQNFKQESLLSDQLISIIAGLNWFGKTENKISVNYNGFHHFLLKIAAENHYSSFTVEPEYFYNRENQRRDIDDFNHLITDLIERSDHGPVTENPRVKTAIVIPPIRRSLGKKTLWEFEPILSILNEPAPDFDKAILILPFNVANSTQPSYQEMRKKLVLSNSIDTIVALPNGMIEKTAVNLVMFIFDFRLRSDTIFFVDATQNKKDDWQYILKFLNKKSVQSDFSEIIQLDQIQNEKFDLSPQKYVIDVSDFNIEEGNEVFQVHELVEMYRAGIRLKNRNLLYAGGEYQLIRTSDLDFDKLYLEPNQNALGVDHDELPPNGKHLIQGGIVVSTFNKKIKASVLPQNKKFVLGQDVYWLDLNQDLALAEYVVKEFSKPYILKQVQFFSKGAAISRLYLKDLLKIKIQLPSLAKQKELVFADFRKNEQVFDFADTISERELDFIKTLKHTLKQPAAGLANDFSSLWSFILAKVDNKESMDLQETIVPVFDTDTPETVEIHSLESTIQRMERAITDIDYILDRAVQVIDIGKPRKESVDLKSFLLDLKSEYPQINIKVSGPKMDILADAKQLRILIHNFIHNAVKHGFINNLQNPTFWMEIINKDTLTVQLSIRNNGSHLPPEFTIEDFLAKGGSSKSDVGSGFGGFLIGQILSNHQGEIELINQEGFGIRAHNVEFLITLPK